MRFNLFFIRALSVFALAIMLTGSAFAQGKGNKGGGGGKHDGGPPGQQKQADRGGDRGGGQGQVKQQQRQMGGGWQGGGQPQNKHVERQQRQPEQQWQKFERRQQRVYVQPQQRQVYIQPQQRQVYIQPQQRVYVQPQPNWGQIRRQQAFEAKRYRDSMKAQRHAERDAWKFERKQQHFEDKAYRKAGKEYRKSSRPYYGDGSRDVWIDDSYRPTYRTYDNYSPTYRTYDNYRPTYPTYDNYSYGTYPSYVYPDYAVNTFRVFDYSDDYDRYFYGDTYNRAGFDWKTMLLRTVIATFFNNGDNIGYLDPYPQYSYYNDYAYAPNYGYSPNYGYYQPTYNTFGYQPEYTYYEPAAYYGYDQYSSYGLPYEHAAFSSLPYNDMIDLYSGGVAGELIQRALGTGYYQGLLEGQAARRRGWGDRYYQDPYLYEQAMYDPYSSSIGDCRRYFSEGYEMGYHDALRGRDEFDLADGGDIDLVSMLLGTVLDFRG